MKMAYTYKFNHKLILQHNLKSFFSTITSFCLVFLLFIPTPANSQGRKKSEPYLPFIDSNTPITSPDASQTKPVESSQVEETPLTHPQGQPPLGYYDYQLYKSFGGYGLGHGSFQFPVDIDVDKDDYIYVCDRELGSIQKFDSEGNFEEEWDSLDMDRHTDNEAIPLKQSKNFDSPEAICVDYKEMTGKTAIYIADTKNNRVLQFDTKGLLVNLWGEFGSQPGNFHNPADITVDKHDYCYVLDSKNTRIQCFDDKGKFRFEWGGFGSGTGSFLKPIRIAYDQTRFGSIWVIDSKDNRIHQFDLQENFLRAIVPLDKGKKPLPKPTDLCIDSQGFIFITDSELNKIFKYNNDLEFIQAIGQEGSESKKFKKLSGICIDNQERILVVDTGNCCIHILRHF